MPPTVPTSSSVGEPTGADTASGRAIESPTIESKGCMGDLRVATGPDVLSVAALLITVTPDPGSQGPVPQKLTARILGIVNKRPGGQLSAADPAAYIEARRGGG
jgi:hypothetical protein